MVTDFDNVFAQLLAAPELALLDDIALSEAMSKLSEKERYIFLARAGEMRSFEELAARYGLSYKGITAVYYRIIKKLRQELR